MDERVPSSSHSGPPVLSPIGRGRYLDCPDCALSLTPYACEHTVVYKCGQCHGMWFDERKIRAFRDSLAKFDLSKLDIHITPPESNAFVITSCPKCRLVLDEAIYGYNSNVRVYRCARCRGLWLPLRQMINLVDSVKVSQLIAPDVRALLQEIGLVERELQRYRAWSAISRLLCTPIQAVDWRQLFDFLITR